jgi:hypothetical protein
MNAPGLGALSAFVLELGGMRIVTAAAASCANP